MGRIGTRSATLSIGSATRNTGIDHRKRAVSALALATEGQRGRDRRSAPGATDDRQQQHLRFLGDVNPSS